MEPSNYQSLNLTKKSQHTAYGQPDLTYKLLRPTSLDQCSRLASSRLSTRSRHSMGSSLSTLSRRSRGSILGGTKGDLLCCQSRLRGSRRSRLSGHSSLRPSLRLLCLRLRDSRLLSQNTLKDLRNKKCKFISVRDRRRDVRKCRQPWKWNEDCEGIKELGP